MWIIFTDLYKKKIEESKTYENIQSIVICPQFVWTVQYNLSAFFFFFLNKNCCSLMTSETCYITASDKALFPTEKYLHVHVYFLVSPQKLLLWVHTMYLLEAPCWNTSNKYPQHVFMEKFLKFSKLLANVNRICKYFLFSHKIKILLANGRKVHVS